MVIGIHLYYTRERNLLLIDFWPHKKSGNPKQDLRIFVSAQGWNRTADIRIFSPPLYQLSYRGLCTELSFRLVAGEGFEPTTSGL